MGGNYKGKMLGTIGDAGFFSLGRGKNVTCGSGGIIVTNSARIASVIERECRSLEKPRFHENLFEFLKVIILALFMNPAAYWLPAGLPFLKLGETIFCRDFPIQGFSGMRAGLLRDWQRRLEESNRIRKENADYFSKRLGLKIGKAFPVPFLRLPVMTDNKETKDVIYAISSKKGMGIGRMYPVPVNEIEEIKDLFRGRVFPFAKAVAEGLLTVPTHRLLSEKDKERLLCQLSAISSRSSGTLHHAGRIDMEDKEATEINGVSGIK
jgi:dTDP-4-amino-4,6-dideoxygalactose transaminase